MSDLLSHLSKGSEKPAPPKDKLRVYSMRFCPYAERPRLVLAAKGVDYECVNINLKNKPEWFLDNPNPSGLVPMIETPEGKLMPESIICCEYLEDKFPQNPLYPKDPFERNRQRLLIERFGKVSPLFYKVLKGIQSGAAVEEQVQELNKSLGLYEQELAAKNTRFFGGDKPGMLDYLIWPWFERLPLIKQKFAITSENFPKLSKWISAMLEDPTVKKIAFPVELHTRVMIDYYQGKEESQLFE